MGLYFSRYTTGFLLVTTGAAILLLADKLMTENYEMSVDEAVKDAILLKEQKCRQWPKKDSNWRDIEEFRTSAEIATFKRRKREQLKLGRFIGGICYFSLLSATTAVLISEHTKDPLPSIKIV